MTATGVADQATALYADLPAHGRRLRVVVLLDRLLVPAWLAETLAALTTTGACELVALLQVPLPPAAAPRGALAAFLRLDARLAGSARRATASVDLRTRLPALPLHAVPAVERAGRLELDAQGCALVRGLDADVLLGFGLPPAAADLAALATRASWFFERDATDGHGHGLRHLAPLWHGEVTSAGGIVVHDGADWRWLGVDHSATAQLSFARNRACQLLRVPATLARLLRELARGHAPPAAPPPTFAAPGALALGGFVLRLLWRAARRHLPRLGRAEDWLLAARCGTPLDPRQPQAADWQLLATPAGRFWADPSLVEHDGRRWLFVEECPHATRRGRIAVAELDAALRPQQAQVVLDLAWHLSYPLVYRWDDAWWLSVESSAARNFVLYRALDFPARWEPVAELVRGRNVVDGTLHHDGRHWYLFACISESPLDVDRRVWTDLFLFVADTPLGPWRAHPANPLLSDVRRARPAGKLFMHEGRLIRPAQDCSVEYGYAVVFNEVTRLDPEHYAERALGRIEPDWRHGLRGCHTYSAAAGVEIIDAKRLVARWRQRAIAEERT